MPVFPGDAGVSVVDAELSGNGVSQRLAPAGEVVVVEELRSGGNDDDADNRARTAPRPSSAPAER